MRATLRSGPFEQGLAILVTALLTLLCSGSSAVLAQPDAVTEQTVAEYQSRVEADASLTPERREALLGSLGVARDHLAAEAAERERAAQLKLDADQAEQNIADFRMRAGHASQAMSPTELQSQSMEELSARLALLQSERTALFDRDVALQTRLEQRTQRLGEIQSRLRSITARLAILQGSASGTANTLGEQVVALVAAAEKQALLAERERLETEARTEPTLDNVAAAERAWLKDAIAERDQQLKALRAALDSARASKLESELERAQTKEDELRQEFPDLLPLAQSNRELVEQLQSIDRSQRLAEEDRNQLQIQLEQVTQNFLVMQRRLEAAGHKVALAQVMVQLLGGLPNVRSLERAVQRRNGEIADSSLVAIDTEEELRLLVKREDFQQRWLPDQAETPEKLLELITILARERQSLLQETMSGLAGLQRSLVESNQIASELILEVGSFEQFLSGNLLWIRSYTAIEPKQLVGQIASLVQFKQWLQFPVLLLEGWRRDHWTIALLISLIAAFVAAKRLRGPFDEVMSRPTPLSGESTLKTMVCIGITMVLSLPWPLLLFLLARSLAQSGNDGALATAVAPALATTAVVLYALVLVRNLIGKRGVCRRLLKNDARMLDALREDLRWAMPVLLVSHFLNGFALYLDVTSGGGPLGALCVATTAAVIALVCVRLLRDDAFLESASVRLGLKLCVAGGLAVILTQLFGLFFAAGEVLETLIKSIVAVCLVNFVVDILRRWLLILRFRIERGNREEDDDSLLSTEANPEAPQQAEDDIDVVELSQGHDKLLELIQTASLAGLLLYIWASLLPAFGLLESITLWNTSVSDDPADGLRAVTLFDLLVAVFILVVTGLLTKHLPSMIQVLMSEWARASSGARYATGMLIQYVVIAIGLSLCLSIIGWQWSKVQWLVAALGVGIGFGLQEIVANFISGLILLFERPIRVGDIITVGGAEGSVRRISARATLIETFDRKEVLIPNKQLITEQVTNWSLSDAAVRVLIPVGVAYGSDVRQARRLLLEAARENEAVLQDPEPIASFDDFGNDALLLTLRCYVAENRLMVWTLLREAINDKFAAAGLEIAFPQRDVHLDMGQPLRIEWSQMPALQPGGAGA
ncbi:MAG: mechanosensitive ion channel domain-containing protein [Pseudomonadota bacterium]